MERLFFGGILAFFLIIMRFVLISDPHFGAAVTEVIAISFLILGGRYASNYAKMGVAPCLENPGHDLDDATRAVQTVECRADGIE